MSRFRKILCLLPLILILTASSAVSVFAESGTVFAFTFEEETEASTLKGTEIAHDSDHSDSDTAPATGDTNGWTYIITVVCAGGAAVSCYIKFKSIKIHKS